MYGYNRHRVCFEQKYCSSFAFPVSARVVAARPNKGPRGRGGCIFARRGSRHAVVRTAG